MSFRWGEFWHCSVCMVNLNFFLLEAISNGRLLRLSLPSQHKSGDASEVKGEAHFLLESQLGVPRGILNDFIRAQRGE